MAVLAGLALVEQNVKDKLALDEALQAGYERVQGWLDRFVSEGRLQAAERAEAGAVLGHLGDPRFDRDVAAGRPATLGVILDGRRSNAAQIVAGGCNAMTRLLPAFLGGH